MSTNMKYMDAGKKIEGLSMPDVANKSYPRFTVDLEQFPGLKADVDESIELHLRGRVCAVRHTDYCNDMEIEVTSVAVPSHTNDRVGPMNEADRALGKLKDTHGY